MNIVFFTRQKGRVGSINLSRARIAVLAASFVALPVALIYGGYQLGQTSAHNNPDPVAEQLRGRFPAFDAALGRVHDAQTIAGQP